jgi:hypothetical protein
MPKTDKPNILIIWGDDIGWFNVSVNNNDIMGYRTPNIDRIAKEGCNFTDWYGQQSCTAYHDLILVLSAEDKRLFDAIDGRRSIANIAERASGDHHRVRALFEKLWWDDQVVFDTSHA